jgi:hypothetical protein
VTFDEKIAALKVQKSARIVARTRTTFGALRLYVIAPDGLAWFYVWDDPSSPTNVRWYAVQPPRSAAALTKVESGVRVLMERDLAELKANP